MLARFRRLSPVARLLVGARAARSVGQGALVVAFTLYLHALDWSGTSIGALLMASLLLGAVLTLAFGPLSDRVGRRRMIVIYEFAQALAAAGVSAGRPIVADGVRFIWPRSAPGTFDNVIASGQLIRVDAPLGTRTLAFLGAATNGPIAFMAALPGRGCAANRASAGSSRRWARAATGSATPPTPTASPRRRAASACRAAGRVGCRCPCSRG